MVCNPTGFIALFMIILSTITIFAIMIVSNALRNAFDRVRVGSVKQIRFPFQRTVLLFSTNHKNFLDVPFELKDEAKALGARWDTESKKWYIPDGIDPSLFVKFTKSFLTVPYAEKDVVKALGARWDKEKMKWYVPSGKDISLFSKWISSDSSPPKNLKPKSATSVNNSSNFKSKVATTSAAKTNNFVMEDPSQCIVLLSIDTNGLPVQDKGTYLPYDDLGAYDSSRLIQLSYQLCRLRDMQSLSTGTFTIQSDGFPIDNSEYHNITLELSKSSGVPFTEAAEKTFDAIKKANFLVAHNADFVYSVLCSELFRHGMLDLLNTFDTRTKYCSMALTQDILGLKDKRGELKKPSLKELVQATTGEDLPSVRNSSANVEYLRKAVQILVNTDRLKFGTE